MNIDILLYRDYQAEILKSVSLAGNPAEVRTPENNGQTFHWRKHLRITMSLLPARISMDPRGHHLSLRVPSLPLPPLPNHSYHKTNSSKDHKSPAPLPTQAEHTLSTLDSPLALSSSGTTYAGFTICCLSYASASFVRPWPPSTSPAPLLTSCPIVDITFV